MRRAQRGTRQASGGGQVWGSTCPWEQPGPGVTWAPESTRRAPSTIPPVTLFLFWKAPGWLWVKHACGGCEDALSREWARLVEHGPSGAFLCFLAMMFVHSEEKSFTACPSTAFAPAVRRNWELPSRPPHRCHRPVYPSARPARGTRAGVVGVLLGACGATDTAGCGPAWTHAGPWCWDVLWRPAFGKKQCSSSCPELEPFFFLSLFV